MTRNEAVKFLQQLSFTLDSNKFSDAVDTITRQEIPMADCLQAHWNEVKTNDGDKLFVCSNCGAPGDYDNFCRNCGADMNGDDE